MAACGDGATAPAPVVPLEIDASLPTLFVGDEVELHVLGWPGVAPTGLLWQSSNTGVAQVSPTGRLRALSSGSVTVTVESDASSDETTLEVFDLPPRFRSDEIEYFGEVAFGSENGGGEPVLRKWVTPPRIQVFGDPTAEDLDALVHIVTEVNALAPGLGMEIVTDAPTVEIHFVPAVDFPDLEPHYVPGNLGFFWAWWNGWQELVYARVLLATEGVTQPVREHLLREELTQALGLMQDSWSYPESIFYQGWTETGNYAPIDRTLLEMLYRDDLDPGEPREEALARLRAVRLDRKSLD